MKVANKYRNFVESSMLCKISEPKLNDNDCIVTEIETDKGLFLLGISEITEEDYATCCSRSISSLYNYRYELCYEKNQYGKGMISTHNSPCFKRQPIIVRFYTLSEFYDVEKDIEALVRICVENEPKGSDAQNKMN